jgi:hypothetical protein
MTRFILISVLASVIGITPSICRAQEQSSQTTIKSLSKSADEKLAQSIDELNRLREQIAAEKLPLAQELSALEEKLTQLRREHDRVTRLVDEGKLEITNIKSDESSRG